MITLEYVKSILDGIYEIDLEEILRLIIVVPFTLMVDFTIGLVIFTILLNIIGFTLKFI